jgi:hypothetical protein
MKKILLALLFSTSFLVGQIKLVQMQPCIIGGVKEDSCFIMTDTNGIQKYVPISVLRNSLPGGGTLVANPDGSYTYTPVTGSTTVVKYTCSVIQDTVIRIYNQQGSLASTCNITGLGRALKNVSVSSDTTLSFQNNSGQTYTVNLCPFIKNCETHDTLTYNTITNNLSYKNESGNTIVINLNESTVINDPSGTYIHTNELGVNQTIGYSLNCLNDSTIQLIDHDGTIINTCIIAGGTGTSETITDINNLNNGAYEYINELGVKDTFGYKFDISDIPNNGFLYITDWDGTRVDSVNLCNPNCPYINAIAVNDTFNAIECTKYIGILSANDTECDNGIGIYSLVDGTVQGGYANIDANGSFIYYFENCNSISPHGFSYQYTCKDGSIFYADVTINLPGCGGAVANLDMYSGSRNTPISFSVSPNDTLCINPASTTYTIKINPTNGAMYLNSNGTGLYTSLPTFTGTDSSLIEIRCDGVICDTSWIKFTIINQDINDDYYQLVAGGTLLGLDATSNDEDCNVGVTTYAWNGALFPSTAGNLSGNPDNFDFESDELFCGVAFRNYDQFCNGIYNKTATVYFYVSCGNAINDTWTTLDTLFLEDVAMNDAACSNGGSSTWHILNNLTAHGVVSIAPFNCVGDCPGITADPVVKIVSWDTITGSFTLDFPTNFSGSVCFKYVLKCKSGGTTLLDTACVRVSRILNPEMSFTVTYPDTSSPTFLFNLGAWCKDANGTKQLLFNGDKLHFNLVTLQGTVDVDLVIGQNIKSGAGYTNDVGNRWQNWIVPSLPAGTVTLDRVALFNNTFSFVFRKDTFARKSDNWGDGTNTVNEIGQQLYPRFNICCATCNSSTFVYDTIYKLWSAIDINQWVEKGSLYTCTGVYGIEMIQGNNAFYVHPVNSAIKFVEGTPPFQYRTDTTSGWVNINQTGNTGGGYIQAATFCPLFDDSRDSINEWRMSYKKSVDFSNNITPMDLEVGVKSDIHRYRAAQGGQEIVRLYAGLYKQSIFTGLTLSLLNPTVRYYSTYVNGLLARPVNDTIKEIAFYVGHDPGDYANNALTRDEVFKITTGIGQNVFTTIAIPSASYDPPYNKVWTEGAYHHYGYMLSQSNRLYSITNGQVIIFSF